MTSRSWKIFKSIFVFIQRVRHHFWMRQLRATAKSRISVLWTRKTKLVVDWWLQSRKSHLSKCKQFLDLSWQELSCLSRLLVYFKKNWKYQSKCFRTDSLGVVGVYFQRKQTIPSVRFISCKVHSWRHWTHSIEIYTIKRKPSQWCVTKVEDINNQQRQKMDWWS